jgi:hypothetical protein
VVHHPVQNRYYPGYPTRRRLPGTRPDCPAGGHHQGVAPWWWPPTGCRSVSRGVVPTFVLSSGPFVPRVGHPGSSGAVPAARPRGRPGEGHPLVVVRVIMAGSHWSSVSLMSCVSLSTSCRRRSDQRSLLGFLPGTFDRADTESVFRGDSAANRDRSAAVAKPARVIGSRCTRRGEISSARHNARAASSRRPRIRASARP